MCGRARYTLRVDDVAMACYCGGAGVRYVDTDRYRQSYNISPGANVPVVHRDGEGVVVHCMRWGLIPSFTKKTENPDFYKMFNARSESVAEKASFRRLIPKNRCLVPVEGFYEWKKDGSKKQPYYIHFKDDRPLVFAALYDSWKNAEGEMFMTFTILTTSSSSSLLWLHDRMPVIFGDKRSADAWLGESPPTKLNALLKPYENSDLVWYPVTPAMGKTSFNGPECIKEVPLKTEARNTISKFFSATPMKKSQTVATGDECFDCDHVKTKHELQTECRVKIEELNQLKENMPEESMKTDIVASVKEELPSEMIPPFGFGKPERDVVNGTCEFLKANVVGVVEDESQVEAIRSSHSGEEITRMPEESKNENHPLKRKSETERKCHIDLKCGDVEKEEFRSSGEKAEANESMLPKLSEKTKMEQRLSDETEGSIPPERSHQLPSNYPTKKAGKEIAEDSGRIFKKAKESPIKLDEKSVGAEKQPTLLSYFNKK